MTSNMPNEFQEKIKEILKEAKSVALLSEQNPNEEVFLLKNCFELGLKNLGADVLTFPQNEENEISSSYKEKWLPLFENINETSPAESVKTIIKIPKKDFVIKELSYNEDNDFFSLVITSNNGKLAKETAIFETIMPEPQAVFCFFENKENLENFKPLLKFPVEENIIFLNHLAGHSVPDKSDTKYPTITGRIANLMQLLEMNFSAPVLNFLFAALVVETNHFKDYSDKEIFSLANFLLGRGASADAVRDILENQKTNSFIQLTGRAAARSHYEEQLGVSWSFLSDKDFEKTSHSPSLELILKVTKEIVRFIKKAEIFVICWKNTLAPATEFNQPEKTVLALIKSLDNSFLRDTAQKFGVQPQSDYLVVGPFQNFSEAEIKIRETLNSH